MKHFESKMKNWIRATLFFLAASFFIHASASAQTHVKVLYSTPGTDGWIKASGYPPGFFGSPCGDEMNLANQLRVGNTNNDFHAYRSFVSFDIAPLKGREVLSAVLFVFQMGTGGSYPTVVDVVDYGPTLKLSDWCTSSLRSDIGTIPNGVSAAFKSVDITSSLAFLLSLGNTRAQFRLRSLLETPISPSGYATFYGGEAFASGLAPKIEVTLQNAAPIPTILEDQVVAPGATVTLDGSHSSDPDGDTLSFSWTQKGGPAVVLKGANTSKATFVAPQVASESVLQFELAVSDGFLSAKATAKVTVQPEPSITFAHFGNGRGITSDLVLTNPSPLVVASGKVELFDDNGLPLTLGISGSSAQSRIDFSLPPLGAVTISTDGRGNVATGSVRVTSSNSVGGVIRFNVPGVGTAGVGESQLVSGFITPVRRRLGGINSGIALRNAESTPVTLTLSLRNTKGQELTNGARSIVLPGGGHTASFINELFPTAATDDFEGTLVIQAAGGKVAAAALELGPLPGQFTALPVVSIR